MPVVANRRTQRQTPSDGEGDDDAALFPGLVPGLSPDGAVGGPSLYRVHRILALLVTRLGPL